jgi:hypothetical protein
MEKKKFDVKFLKLNIFYLKGAQAWDICDQVIYTEQSHLNS